MKKFFFLLSPDSMGWVMPSFSLRCFGGCHTPGKRMKKRKSLVAAYICILLSVVRSSPGNYAPLTYITTAICYVANWVHKKHRCENTKMSPIDFSLFCSTSPKGPAFTIPGRLRSMFASQPSCVSPTAVFCTLNIHPRLIHVVAHCSFCLFDDFCFGDYTIRSQEK